MRKGAIALGLGSSALVAALCAAVSAPATSGCTTHQCDPNHYTFTGGEAIDENTWESNPLNGRWLDFNENVTIFVVFPPPFDFGRQPAYWEVFTGLSADANAIDSQMTSPSGQLDLVSSVVGGSFTEDGGRFLPGGLTLVNGTCASYFVRVVVHFYPVDGGAQEAGAGDGGVPPDATGAIPSPGGGQP